MTKQTPHEQACMNAQESDWYISGSSDNGTYCQNEILRCDHLAGISVLVGK